MSRPAMTELPSSLDLLVGDTVEIQGLSGAKELNGRRGRLVTFVSCTGRFGVQVDGEEENKAIKPANLKRLEQYPNPLLTADVRERLRLEKRLAEVMEKIKDPSQSAEDSASLKDELQSLVVKL